MTTTGPVLQPETGSSTPPSPPPLYVDLDGTLIATDLLCESIFLLLKRHPIDALKIPLWLFKGRAHLKRELAARVTPDFETLPYRPEILERLRKEKSQGRTIVLATASDERLAKGVADHLKIFDHIIASDGRSNRRSEEKLAAIQSHCGSCGFDYIGDCAADLPVWRASRTACIVNPRAALLRRFPKDRAPDCITATQPPLLKSLIRSMRPHQWIKNLLLFIPLVMAHRIFLKTPTGHYVFNLKDITAVFVAFACFSLTAAAVYILNDLLDVPSDRRHPSKSRRPFASGALPVQLGPPVFLGLLIISFALSAFLLPLNFTALLALYLILTTLYSLLLKQRLILDVMFLAGLYTHRILAGGAAINVEVSHFLLAFSIFLFLSLAWAKRYSELKVLEKSPQGSGRSYTTDDLSIIESVGPCAGYIAILVFSLYIHNDVARTLYHRPIFLWLICPLLLYWITRIWFFAKRGALHDDPIIFAIRDRVSWITAAAAAILLLLAL